MRGQINLNWIGHMVIKLTLEELENGKSPKGGYTKEKLASWGVPYPPPKGWKELLLAGEEVKPRGVSRDENPVIKLDRLLRSVVMAIIDAGQAHILAGMDELNEYLRTPAPSVGDFVGSQKYKLVDGTVELSDKVYRFSCIRKVS